MENVVGVQPMYKSVFDIKGLDCPCEEVLIRTRLQDIGGIHRQEYDFAQRRLTLYHEGEVSPITAAIATLHLGSELRTTELLAADEGLPRSETKAGQATVLVLVLLINFALFVVELFVGWLAHSMGLIADSLDMLADASVYGLSLWAVGATVGRKRKVALVAGYLQIVLALVGLVEVFRRFVGVEELPSIELMTTTSLLALLGNGLCLWLLQRTKSQELHIRASLIFSSNDVIINLGVIVAGIMVWLTASPLPDLVIGCVVFVLVSCGAWRILRLA